MKIKNKNIKKLKKKFEKLTKLNVKKLSNLNIPLIYQTYLNIHTTLSPSSN